MEALSRGDLKLTGKLLEPLSSPAPHPYNKIHSAFTSRLMHVHHERTESIPSHLVFVASLPIRHTGFSSTHSAHLHPLTTRYPYYLPPPKKQNLAENVSQRWFFVSAPFSQRHLTKYRSSTDVFTAPVVTLSVCRPDCKIATGRIACSAGDTSTPLVSAVICPPVRMVYSRHVSLLVTGCKSQQCKR